MKNQLSSSFKSRPWNSILCIFGTALLIPGLAEMLFMGVSARAFQWYLTRKGDVA